MKISKILLSSIIIIGLNAADKEHTITIAVSPVPHAEIMEFVKPILAKSGYDLKISEISDYQIPNIATDNGDIDANFFQHTPYLQQHNKSKGTNLVSAVSIHLEPMGFYSKKIKNINELKSGSKVAIAHDPSNENRALRILEKNGLIKLNNVTLATPQDIIQNPKNIQFIELEGALIPRILDDVDLAAISTNFILDMGMNPSKDALIIESTDSPYANIIAVKSGNENSPKINALIKAVTNENVKDFIIKKYKGAILPVF